MFVEFILLFFSWLQKIPVICEIRTPKNLRKIHLKKLIINQKIHSA